MATTNGARESLPPLDVIKDRPMKDGQRRATLGYDGIVEIARMDYYPCGKSEAYLRLLCAAPDLCEACARIQDRHARDEGAWMLDDDEVAALRAALAKAGAR